MCEASYACGKVGKGLLYLSTYRRGYFERDFHGINKAWQKYNLYSPNTT